MENIFDALVLPSIVAAIVALVIGAISTYMSSIKIEKFRIKSVIIQSNVDKIITLLKCIDRMRVAYVEPSKSFLDLTMDIDLDYIEKNLVTLSSIVDINGNGGVDNKWHTNFSHCSEDVNKFATKEIICFNHILREYLTTLDYVISQIDPRNKWQLGYIITVDLRFLADLYQKHLYDYLNRKIYKPKFKNNYDEKLINKYRKEVLEKTRLYSKGEEIKKLY